MVEVRPNPSWSQRSRDQSAAESRQVADRVKGDLWIVGARLDRQITAALRRNQVVVRKGGKLCESSGAAIGEAEPVVEKGWTKAEGDRQVGRAETGGFTGVDGWRQRSIRDAWHRLALRHGGGGARPRAQQVAQIAKLVGLDVERAEDEPVLSRRGDAGLVIGVERSAGRKGLGRQTGRFDSDERGAGESQTACQQVAAVDAHEVMSAPERETRGSGVRRRGQRMNAVASAT